ncbi:hypothetical protein HU200_022623 [Digitaria exilis]|uniref:Uncharacterized protein n=1 Tax=Digitaria exilis TaxID=1010633 RepID=A0A835EYI2_9POAL|nr:hypothetical protein HU200_022623 [Digitaria exilis]
MPPANCKPAARVSPEHSAIGKVPDLDLDLDLDLAAPTMATFVAAIDGAITFVEADGDPAAVEAASRRRDRGAAANRGLDQREDPAEGWSSAVPERSLALRRRGRSATSAAAAPCSRQCSGSARTTAGEERGCRVEEVVAAPGALGMGARGMAAKAQVVLDTVAFDYLVVL